MSLNYPYVVSALTPQNHKLHCVCVCVCVKSVIMSILRPYELSHNVTYSTEENQCYS